MILLSFHGAARTVTGSRYLLEVNGRRLMIDCGMFQGLKALREQNWKPTAFEPRSVDRMLLTHAHIDHSGYLPRFVREGYRSAVHATSPTAELARFMLLDSAHLQMEDAEFLNRKRKTKHSPALPLYVTDDVEAAMKLFRPEEYDSWKQLDSGVSFRMLNVGHLLGSAMIQLRIQDGGRSVTVLFSGDVGRYGMPINPDPVPPPESDYLVLESTYGDRCHCNEDVNSQLEILAGEVLSRGGILLVPAFAVGRAQQIIYLLQLLVARGKLPRVPIHLDSPMALEATKVYEKYRGQNRPPEEELRGGGAEGTLHLVHTQQESMALNGMSGPAVIISSSGMMTGGRILHHIKHHASDPRNLILLIGYQAEGTRGRALQEGARAIRIHHEEIEVAAAVAVLQGLSGHADHHELLKWLSGFPPPKSSFVTHGEEAQALALAGRLQAERGFSAQAPEMGQQFTL